MSIPDDEETRLRRNLERWRQNKLTDIAEQIPDLNQDYRDAQEGLAIAHRNPGYISDDVVEYLWDKLNSSATELTRLEEEHERLRTMDPPRLIIEANLAAARLKATSPHSPPPEPAETREQPRTSPIRSGAPGTCPDQPPADQVDEIVAAWRDLLGIELNPERVRRHLASINKWQQQWEKRRDNAGRT